MLISILGSGFWIAAAYARGAIPITTRKVLRRMMLCSKQDSRFEMRQEKYSKVLFTESKVHFVVADSDTTKIEMKPKAFHPDTVDPYTQKLKPFG